MLKAVAPPKGVGSSFRMDGHCPSSQEAAVMLQFMAAAAAQSLPNQSDHASLYTAPASQSAEGENPLPVWKRSSPEPPSSSRCTHITDEPLLERGKKRSRSVREVRTPETFTTPYLGPIDHNKEPIRPFASSGLISASRFDVSHGDWGAVASNSTTAALDPDTVVSLLQDPAFRPGPRPSTFAREMGTWVFKEGRDFHIRGKAAAGHHSDRWHNSGGSKAARDLPPDKPVIRRRYGSLAQQDGQKYRYHEYYLISYDSARGCYVEDRSVTLFHVMLPLSEMRGSFGIAVVPRSAHRKLGGR